MTIIEMKYQIAQRATTPYNLNGKTERIGVEFASEQYFDKLTLRKLYIYTATKLQMVHIKK